jgi:hypothetical protein
MPSSGMLRSAAGVRTDVSKELSTSFIWMTRIGELGTTLAVTSVRRLLVTASVFPSSTVLVAQMKEALSSSDTSVLTRATRRSILEDGILQLMLFTISEYQADRNGHAGSIMARLRPLKHWDPGFECHWRHGHRP